MLSTITSLRLPHKWELCALSMTFFYQNKRVNDDMNRKTMYDLLSEQDNMSGKDHTPAPSKRN